MSARPYLADAPALCSAALECEKQIIARAIDGAGRGSAARHEAAAAFTALLSRCLASDTAGAGAGPGAGAGAARLALGWLQETWFIDAVVTAGDGGGGGGHLSSAVFAGVLACAAAGTRVVRAAAAAAVGHLAGAGALSPQQLTAAAAAAAARLGDECPAVRQPFAELLPSLALAAAWNGTCPTHDDSNADADASCAAGLQRPGWITELALAPQRQAFRSKSLATLLDYLALRPQRLPPDWIRRMMHQCPAIPPPTPVPSSLSSSSFAPSRPSAVPSAAGTRTSEDGQGSPSPAKSPTKGPARSQLKAVKWSAAGAGPEAKEGGAGAAGKPGGGGGGGGADVAADVDFPGGNGGSGGSGNSNVEAVDADAGGLLSATLRCSDDAAAWWAVQEAARHCVAARLRTHFGNATETLALLERCLRAAARPNAGGGGAMTATWLLLELMGGIERSLYNAYEGTATLPPPGKTAAAFFRANQRVCEDWLG